MNPSQLPEEEEKKLPSQTHPESDPQQQQPQLENQEEEEDNEENLDSDLLQLNLYLAGLKKDRRQTEKDARILRDRHKILNQEENKAAKKYEQETKNQENMDKIRVRVLQDKEMMEANRKKKHEKLQEQKLKNNNLKSNIDNTMKSWRPCLTQKNKTHADLLFKERCQIKQAIRLNKEKKDNKNKEMRDAILFDHSNFLEQKKLEEKQRKKDLIKKYKEMITQELFMRDKLEEKINQQKEKNNEILKRIKDYNDNMIGNNKHYSVSVKKISKRNTTNNLKKKEEK